MRKELQYFSIDKSYGGNQSWLRDPMMRLGGCGAATACDSCICLGLLHNKKGLYPYKLDQLSKEDYIRFVMEMKPYLRPRIQGINTLKLFIEGFSQFLADQKEYEVGLEEFSGENSLMKAKEAIRRQIRINLPIPYLLLRHKSQRMKFFVWHWFLIIGYEEFEEEFYVKAVTYGNYHWLSLKELWDTGYKEKGGMVIINTASKEEELNLGQGIS